MLWTEAVFRGIRPVANRELLHARMFPKSENGLSLPRTKSVADVPAPDRCNGHDGVLPGEEGPKRKRAEPDEDEEEVYEDDFEVLFSRCFFLFRRRTEQPVSGDLTPSDLTCIWFR